MAMPPMNLRREICCEETASEDAVCCECLFMLCFEVVDGSRKLTHEEQTLLIRNSWKQSLNKNWCRARAARSKSQGKSRTSLFPTRTEQDLSGFSQHT